MWIHFYIMFICLNVIFNQYHLAIINQNMYNKEKYQNSEHFRRDDSDWTPETSPKYALEYQY